MATGDSRRRNSMCIYLAFDSVEVTVMSVSNWRAILVLLVVLVLATALAHPAVGSGKNLWTRRQFRSFPNLLPVLRRPTLYFHSFRFFNDTLIS